MTLETKRKTERERERERERTLACESTVTVSKDIISLKRYTLNKRQNTTALDTSQINFGEKNDTQRSMCAVARDTRQVMERGKIEKS